MLVFRYATQSDVARISTLVNKAFRGEDSKQGWTTEAEILGGQRTDDKQIGQAIAASDQKILLALDTTNNAIGPVLVGCANITMHPQCVYLGMLSVQPMLQGHGIGRQILAEVETIARSNNTPLVRITVIHLREDLIAYYVRRGYKATGCVHPFPELEEGLSLPKVPHLELVEFEKHLI